VIANAYRMIKEDNPFPAICGRVGNHVCETAFSCGSVDELVSIMRLERFVADWAFEHPEEVTKAFRYFLRQLHKYLWPGEFFSCGEYRVTKKVVVRLMLEWTNPFPTKSWFVYCRSRECV
jgi:hypothetical protein